MCQGVMEVKELCMLKLCKFHSLLISVVTYTMLVFIPFRLDHIQLFRKRWLQPNVVIKADPHSMKYGFDFYQLQFDIINEFIVNKPLIDDPRQNLRVKFFFQKKGSPESCIPSLIFSVSEAEETQYRNWVIGNYMILLCI